MIWQTNIALALKLFFKIYIKYNNRLPLALNIKSDGLQVELKKLIIQYKIENYFVFDMSVPDSLGYIKNELNTFTRESEFEEIPSCYDESSGIWLDEFKTHWINRDKIKSHIKSKKQICIVSPDLHKREYKKEWQHYKEIEQELGIRNLMICTDFPKKAKEFFDE